MRLCFIGLHKKMSLGQRIRDARKRAGLSQAELGSRLTPPRTSQGVGGWERDEYHPDHETLIQISEQSDVSLTWLITGSDLADASVVGQGSQRGRTVPSVEWLHVEQFIEKKYIPEMSARSHFPCGPRSFHTVFADRSMEPEIGDGDGLIVDTEMSPQPGDLVMVRHADSILVRKYRPRIDHVELVPVNADWPTIIVPGPTLPPNVLIGVVSETSRRRR